MANAFSNSVDILFTQIIKRFDALNVTSQEVAKFKIGSGELQQAGQTVYRPVELQTETTDGRDVSSAYKDLTELTVPVTLTESHIRNVALKFTGTDLNNERVLNQLATISAKKLSNVIDTIVADKIASNGTLAVINSGAIDTQEDAAEADVLMLEQQVTNNDRIMLLNPRMSQKLVGDLSSRQTLNKVNLDAYEKNMLPMIAGFDTFRVDYAKAITGSTGSGYLINGGSQGYTPVTSSSGLPVDNRTQTLAVDTGSNAAVGDIFTIANVYAVGHINKQSTGSLKTFRIIAINGANWTISPPIIPANGSAAAQKAYANVTTAPADNAAITILNTVTKPCSVFLERSAVEIVHSDFNLEPFIASGKSVRTATTDSGLKISMVSDSNIDTLVASYRMFIWANAEVINPSACGVMLPNQT